MSSVGEKRSSSQAAALARVHLLDCASGSTLYTEVLPRDYALRGLHRGFACILRLIQFNYTKYYQSYNVYLTTWFRFLSTDIANCEAFSYCQSISLKLNCRRERARQEEASVRSGSFDWALWYAIYSSYIVKLKCCNGQWQLENLYYNMFMCVANTVTIILYVTAWNGTMVL